MFAAKFGTKKQKLEAKLYVDLIFEPNSLNLMFFPSRGRIPIDVDIG